MHVPISSWYLSILAPAPILGERERVRLKREIEREMQRLIEREGVRERLKREIEHQ